MPRRLAALVSTLAAAATLLPAAAQAQNIPMVRIPAGRFVMGSCLPPSEKDRFMGKTASCGAYDADAYSEEGPQRTVHVKAFELGKTEVTLGQFKQYIRAAGREDLLTDDFMKHNAHGDNAPVVEVSWNDAQAFIRWLNQTQGGGWRLPTEAEWEYACRAGGKHRYCGSNDLNAVGWFDDNSGGRQRAVAQKAPNAFGLYDMTGNVWEWVQDCWHDSYRGAPTDGSAWTGNCEEGDRRVARGGSWNLSARYARAAIRISLTPGIRLYNFGFRLARTVAP
ncbi:formylglycine-generating enzyme family protein [Allofranklinella schreckenbergeri]|uniref:formylglycine-generating enzyme family protein n=1 Tax=Allofranklinella schreckenbergeri TaxID=1076744 RepID=UPI001EEF0DBF|nr:SUMF1/EgtB/PvdO family nonheme iron enzyme [Allofranklinella schreckenbergeri]